MKKIEKNIGIILALTAGVCFGLSNTFAGLAYSGGATPFTMSATRFFLPSLILTIIILAQGNAIFLPTRASVIAVLLGVVTILYTIALLEAFQLILVPIAVLIFYLFPIFTGIILKLLGWGQFNMTKAVCAVVAFSGLGLTLMVQIENIEGTGIILAALAALGLALVSVVSQRLIKDEDPRQATLYMAASALMVMVVLVVIEGSLPLPSNITGWVGFSLSNIMYAAAMISFFYAISISGAGTTTFLTNIEPLVVVGTAFLFLDQSLTIVQLFGVLVVVLALIFYARTEA
ncbi:MAG: hypothetical protein CFH08_00361 [Alphaproteobacteria bacterium MarineAlpha3_Bin7]|nr:MAG: hypothetical protein CFH08_00361 [Alphaproteobacteria bacterium MarineAlpha3_Bin7]